METKYIAAIVIAIAVVGIFGWYITQPSPIDEEEEDVGPTPEEKVWQETLVIGTFTAYATLDPPTSPTVADIHAIIPSYDALTELRPGVYDTGEPYPGLATSWSVSEDGLTWTFELREGVTFYPSGAPFNATAVKYSFDRLIYHWGSHKQVKEVNIVDTYTVQYILIEPFSALPVFMSSHELSFRILDPSINVTYPDTGPMETNEYLHDHTSGTGPYYVKEWLPREHVIYEQNPTWWKGWENYPNAPKTVIMYTNLADTSQLMMLARGDLDIAHVSYGMVPEIKAAAAREGLPIKFLGEGYAIPSPRMFYLDNSRLPTSDRNIRRALRAAFDADFYCNVEMEGMGIPSIGPLAPGQFGAPEPEDWPDPDRVHLYHKLQA